VLRFDVTSVMGCEVPISGSSGEIVLDGGGDLYLYETSNFAGTIEVISGTLHREY